MAQSNGNGAVEGAAHFFSAPTEFAPLTIGGREIKVPALTLATIDKVKDEIKSLGPDLWWVDYGRACVRIVAASLEDTQPDLTFEVLAKVCTAGELRNMPANMIELFRISGFIMGEEAAQVEENPGTSTQTPLPPNSLPRESAAEISVE